MDTSALSGTTSRSAMPLWHRLGFDTVSLVCCLACSAVFSYWMIDLTGELSIAGGAFFLLLPPSLFSLGQAVLAWVRWAPPEGHSFPLAFVIGTTLAAVLLFFADFATPLAIRGGWIVLLAVSLLINWYFRPAGIPVGQIGDGRYTVLAVVLSLAAGTLWTQDLRPYAVRNGNQIAYRSWEDCFVFAQLTAQIAADQNLAALGNPDLHGYPLPPYHYASFIYPAAVAAWTGRSGFDAVTAFWVPFGVVLTGLAAYALASAWWGNMAGLAAVIGLLLIPDASHYGLGVRWYSYHWLTVVSPGLAYGLVAVAGALAIVTPKAAGALGRARAVAVGLAASTVFIKAQILLPSLPLLMGWLVLTATNWSWRIRAAILTGLVAAGGAVAYAADQFGVGPSLWPFGHEHGISEYIKLFVERKMYGGRRKAFFAPLLEGDTLLHPVRAPLAVMFYLGASIGAFLLVGPLLALIAAARRRLSSVDAVPALGVLVVLLLAFVPPTNQRGTIDEVWHRPFVLSYFLMSIWCFGKSVNLLTDGQAPRQKLGFVAMAGLGVVLLTVPLVRGKTIQPYGAPWGASVVLSIGQVECGEFLRRHADETDIVQEDVPRAVSYLGWLAERRCYLGRSPAFWQSYFSGSPLPAVALARAETLSRLTAAQTVGELRRAADETGIRWYVTHPGQDLRWPPEVLAKTAFESGGYRVYDLRTATDGAVAEQ